MRSTQWYVPLVAAALIGHGEMASAGDVLISWSESWHVSTRQWVERNLGTKMALSWSDVSPDYGALRGAFGLQGMPFPDSDAFVAEPSSSDGDFCGDYWTNGFVPHSFSFDFLAADVLPSHVWLGFHGGTNTFFASVTSQVAVVGSWARVHVPLDYDTNVWSIGNGEAFSNSLTDVDWVEVRVVRSGTGLQEYYLDNFTLTQLVPDSIATNDANGDGIPDYWQDLYFTNSADAAATNDFDNDGVPNRGEWIAGTDPTDSLSNLRIVDMAMAPAATLTFKSTLGREYRAGFVTGIVDTVTWTGCTDWVAGNGGYRTLTVTNALPSAFYRVVGRIAGGE
jgi:hypothetical protein